MKTKAICMLAVCMLPLLVTGCWDKKELEQNAYVIAIGVDESDQKDMLEVTYLIENPQVGTSEIAKAEDEPASEKLTLTVPDWISMQDTAETILSREISFAHTRIIIIGEKLARSGRLFDFIEGGMREPTLSRMVNMVVSREKASTFLETNDPLLDTRPHKYYDLMTLRWKERGMVPMASLNRFVYEMDGDNLFLAVYTSALALYGADGKMEDQYLPGELSHTGGPEAQYIGGAVFRRGKMIGSLNGEELRLTNFLRRVDEAREMLATYPDPEDEDRHITVRITQTKNTKIRINLKSDPIHIQVTVPLNMEILQIPSRINYITNRDKQEILRSHLENSIEEKIDKLIRRTQEEFQGEPFMWYLDARRQFWTWEDYQKFNWHEKYLEAKVDVDVQIDFSGFGKTKRPVRSKS